jgi:hypothetical protein
MAGFHERLQRGLAELPGVSAAGTMTGALTGRGEPRRTWQPAEEPVDLERRRAAFVSPVSPGALEALRVPLLAGRRFDWRDRLDSPRVVLVNRAWQQAYGDGREVVGRRIQLSWRSASHPAGSAWQIVGVVGDVRQAALEREPQPQIYLQAGQFPAEGMTVLLRAERAEPAELERQARALLRSIDGNLEEITLRPLQADVETALQPRRLGLWFVGGFALVALALAAVGVYGVVAQDALLRRHEMAVRLALGARRKQLLALVLGGGWRLMLAGGAVGLAGFVAVERYVSRQFYGVGASDPWAIGGALAVLLAAGTVAALAPGVRAARTDPAQALRDA